ncbi:hypothetical protein D3C81_1753620 [compost metagenome]
MHRLWLDFFEQVKPRRDAKRRQTAQLRGHRRLHRCTKALRRVHDHVDMKRTPGRQAILFLSL